MKKTKYKLMVPFRSSERAEEFKNLFKRVCDTETFEDWHIVSPYFDSLEEAKEIRKLLRLEEEDIYEVDHIRNPETQEDYYINRDIIS